MKTKKYFIIPFLAFLACSCQDDEQGGIQPTPGQDVQFGAALEQSATRTIYGDRKGDAFPIYWVNGDEVVVCSPECATEGGVGSAIYKVNVGESTTQDYATSLDKTGEIGVRWGDNGVGNFYSFYPASRAVLGSDYKTMTVTMPAQQDNNIVGEEATENGKKIKVNPDMRACFMYAKQTANSGETVNLKYIPLSTAIRFTLEGPSSGEVGVSYVRIYAPESTVIDGSFTLNYSGTGKPALSTVTGRNYVTMNAADPVTKEYLTLGPNESAELCVFLLIPQEMTITNDWYMLIGTTDGQVFKKSLGVLANSGGNSTLVPGQVHYLPSLPKLEAGEAWDPANWMVNIQRNVYLSEISIPGSWNSVNSDYQTLSLSQQYQKGVRAFHLDTRWKSWSSVIAGSSGVLGIADGSRSVGDDGNRYMNPYATSFEDALDQIVNSLSENTDEYMVVVCTFAQGSANYVYDTNADGTNKVWIHKISEICNQSKYDGKIVDGSTLTPNTVVGDVLGKIIIIVNTYTEATINDSKCLYMDVRMELDQNEFKNYSYLTRNLNYWDTLNGTSGIKVYATHAQLTVNDQTTTNGNEDSGRGYEPTLLERKNKVEAILNQSKKNYSDLTNYAHDTWMYIGCGGYVDGDDHSPVTSYFLNYMAGEVESMDTEGYYPIGIVYFNQTEADYPDNALGGTSLIQNILEMNNKYRKAYNPSLSPVDGKPLGGGTNTVQSAAPGYSSGMKDNQTDAIGWTRCR